jgi:hypothetical protein
MNIFKLLLCPPLTARTHDSVVNMYAMTRRFRPTRSDVGINSAGEKAAHSWQFGRDSAAHRIELAADQAQIMKVAMISKVAAATTGTLRAALNKCHQSSGFSR